MKTLSLALLLMASMAFVLLGCSDNSSPLVSPTDPVLQAQTANQSLGLSKGEVVHSATGSGHISILDGTPYNDNWSFSATQRADGKCSGQVQYTDREYSYTFHGDVVNLQVEDHGAKGKWAKLDWTCKRGPTYPGMQDDKFGFVVVIDNGEGKNASGPDMISFGILVSQEGAQTRTLQQLKDMTPSEFVSWLIDQLGEEYALYAYQNGNIQVR